MSLHLKDLSVSTPQGERLLGPLDLRLEAGARIGLMGGSACGKSLLGRALLGLLPPGLRVRGALASGYAPLATAWVPQEPEMGLHPLLSVEDHLVLLPMARFREGRPEALGRMRPLLERLRLPLGAAFLRALPHQLSRGQRQRLLVLMALSGRPDFLVLDEPGSALDPGSLGELVGLLSEWHRAHGLGYLWISHDPGLLLAATDHLLVLCEGSLVEGGPTPRVMADPSHPHTARFFRAFRSLGSVAPLGAP